MDDATMGTAVVPEFDEELNHVFFAKSRCPVNDDKNINDTNENASGIEKSKLRKNFYDVYKAFVENRQNLINELRNIADDSVRVKKGCSISTITGSSVGIAGGTAAIVGTFMFPPLLVGGLVVAGLATASNLGTHLVEFIIFRNMVKKVELLSKYDNELMHDIESFYQNAQASNLIEANERTDENKRLMNATNTLPLLGLQLGAGGTKSATALGLRSAGIQVEIGGTVMRGVARGAIGVGVFIDGVTVYFSTRDLLTGCSTKFTEAVNRLADFKEEELGRIMARIDGSDLLLES